jgi:carboxyl-terminal processing protease
VILKIDDKDTTGITLVEAVYLIRGPKDTEVKLTIQSEGASEPKELTLKREVIEIKSVVFEMKDDIAYIELRYFGDSTTSEFRKAVQDLLTKNPKAIILDVRNNAGGYLQTAVDVASEFVEEGQVVAYEEFSNGKRNEFKAKGQTRLKGLPCVVLTNEGSASASEIVAGALRDHGIAKLVGKKTFGKGTVQELENLSSGTNLRVSVAKWLTPKGQDINGNGLAPDIEVGITEDDYKTNKDPQLDKVLEILKEQIK